MPAMSKIVLGVCAVEALYSKNLLSSQNRMEPVPSVTQVADSVNDSESVNGYTISALFRDLRIIKRDGVEYPACDKISGLKYYDGAGAFFEGTQDLTDFRSFTVANNDTATFTNQDSYTDVVVNSSDTAIEYKIAVAAYEVQIVLKEEVWDTHFEGGHNVMAGKSSASPESLAAGKRLDCMFEGMTAFNKEVVGKLSDTQSPVAIQFYNKLLTDLESSLKAWSDL